jgi:dihydrofolate reductase
MTRDGSWTADGAIAVPNIKAAIVAATHWIENTVESRSEIILFGGGEIYHQGLEYCHRVERTVVASTPDGGVEAAYFPHLPAAKWDIEVEAEFAATCDIPSYRYERAVKRGTTKQF